eukprot:747211-Hanusia_phi.AAC.1
MATDGSKDGDTTGRLWEEKWGNEPNFPERNFFVQITPQLDMARIEADTTTVAGSCYRRKLFKGGR